MINVRFEAYKVKRELKRSGIEYEFKRPKSNNFGEPIEQNESVGTLVGIYHEHNERAGVQITTGDTTQVRTKRIPMILCLHDDTASLDLKVGDFTIINERTFKVVGVINVNEWNIISDITLEVIDDGVRA